MTTTTRYPTRSSPTTTRNRADGARTQPRGDQPHESRTGQGHTHKADRQELRSAQCPQTAGLSRSPFEEVAVPKKRRQRDHRSCLVGGQEGNKVPGSAGSWPPEQPTGPTHPGSGYPSGRFKWLPRPPEEDEDG